MGYCPSYAWRSLFSAREVIDLGARWVVGNGEIIKIWKDRWLPSSPEFKVWSPVTNFDAYAMVRELIDPDTRQWKMDLIFASFHSSEAHQIVKLPISLRLPNDKLIWHWENHGDYSVRTAYHFFCENKFNQHSGPSCTADKSLWKEIWHAPVPTKIRNFLCRVAKDILPNCFNLSKKGIRMELLCPLCQRAVEKVEHTFMQCQMAKLGALKMVLLDGGWLSETTMGRCY